MYHLYNILQFHFVPQMWVVLNAKEANIMTDQKLLGLHPRRNCFCNCANFKMFWVFVCVCVHYLYYFSKFVYSSPKTRHLYNISELHFVPQMWVALNAKEANIKDTSSTHTTLHPYLCSRHYIFWCKVERNFAMKSHSTRKYVAVFRGNIKKMTKY